jgi:hypothetical protein
MARECRQIQNSLSQMGERTEINHSPVRKARKHHIYIIIYIYEWIKPEAASTFKLFWFWSTNEQLKINIVAFSTWDTKALRFLANENSVACHWKWLSQVSGGWWGKPSPVGASLQNQSWNFMESLWNCNRGREHLLQEGLGVKAVGKNNELVGLLR